MASNANARVKEDKKSSQYGNCLETHEKESPNHTINNNF